MKMQIDQREGREELTFVSLSELATRILTQQRTKLRPTIGGRRMARKHAPSGDRPPSYMSKATLAAELDMSETTIDSYVQRGLLPKPLKWGGSVRWCWADVAASLKAADNGGVDQFLKGLDNV
ncbi:MULTISPECIES: helix-turn-helix transcriptional regulator [Alphaproteobacteria]|uniref:helix-turn-helix transcriptional regulator n=2 Tax=Pseudomonadota TaxID=1224 RepID=UPI003518E924